MIVTVQLASIVPDRRFLASLVPALVPWDSARKSFGFGDSRRYCVTRRS